MARPRPSSSAGDTAPIVVEADVKNWEPVYTDGPIDPATPDRQINVADDAIIIGVHNWIVRFKVTKVVSGVFEPDEVHMLIHSPSQFGIEAKGRTRTHVSVETFGGASMRSLGGMMAHS